MARVQAEMEEAYQEGYHAASRENAKFYLRLPYLFQQTINEYLEVCSDMGESQAEKADWFTEFLKQAGESEAWLERCSSKETSKIKCNDRGVEYYSGLLMAYHMADTHTTQTSKQ